MPVINDACTNLEGRCVVYLFKDLCLDGGSGKPPALQGRLELTNYNGTCLTDANGAEYFNSDIIETYSSNSATATGWELCVDSATGCEYWGIKTCSLPANIDSAYDPDDPNSVSRALNPSGTTYTLTVKVGKVTKTKQFQIDAAMNYDAIEVCGCIPVDEILVDAPPPVVVTGSPFADSVCQAIKTFDPANASADQATYLVGCDANGNCLLFTPPGEDIDTVTVKYAGGETIAYDVTLDDGTVITAGTPLPANVCIFAEEFEDGSSAYYKPLVSIDTNHTPQIYISGDVVNETIVLSNGVTLNPGDTVPPGINIFLELDTQGNVVETDFITLVDDECHCNAVFEVYDAAQHIAGQPAFDANGNIISLIPPADIDTRLVKLTEGELAVFDITLADGTVIATGSPLPANVCATYYEDSSTGVYIPGNEDVYETNDTNHTPEVLLPGDTYTVDITLADGTILAAGDPVPANICIFLELDTAGNIVETDVHEKVGPTGSDSFTVTTDASGTIVITHTAVDGTVVTATIPGDTDTDTRLVKLTEGEIAVFDITLDDGTVVATGSPIPAGVCATYYEDAITGTYVPGNEDVYEVTDTNHTPEVLLPGDTYTQDITLPDGTILAAGDPVPDNVCIFLELDTAGAIVETDVHVKSSNSEFVFTMFDPTNPAHVPGGTPDGSGAPGDPVQIPLPCPNTEHVHIQPDYCPPATNTGGNNTADAESLATNTSGVNTGPSIYASGGGTTDPLTLGGAGTAVQVDDLVILNLNYGAASFQFPAMQTLGITSPVINNGPANTATTSGWTKLLDGPTDGAFYGFWCDEQIGSGCANDPGTNAANHEIWYTTVTGAGDMDLEVMFNNVDGLRTGHLTRIFGLDPSILANPIAGTYFGTSGCVEAQNNVTSPSGIAYVTEDQSTNVSNPAGSNGCPVFWSVAGTHEDIPGAVDPQFNDDTVDGSNGQTSTAYQNDGAGLHQGDQPPQCTANLMEGFFPQGTDFFEWQSTHGTDFCSMNRMSNGAMIEFNCPPPEAPDCCPSSTCFMWDTDIVGGFIKIAYGGATFDFDIEIVHNGAVVETISVATGDTSVAIAGGYSVAAGEHVDITFPTPLPDETAAPCLNVDLIGTNCPVIPQP